MTDPTDPSERLGALDDDALHALVEEIARTRWETAEVSPPSTDGSVEVVAGDRRLVVVRRVPPDSGLDPPAVAELAAVRDQQGFAAATLVSTAGFSPAAVEVADDAGVDLAGPGDLLAWAREAGAAVPEGGSGRGTGAGTVTHATAVRERYAAHWPGTLIERADAVLDAVEAMADAGPTVFEGNGSTELRYGEPPVRVRFAETSFLVLVDEGDGFEPTVRLTAFREHQPPADELLASLRAAVGAGE